MLDYEPLDHDAPATGDAGPAPEPPPGIPQLSLIPEGPTEYGAPAGAPWNFLDLFFTLMSVLGSLFLAEAVGMIALAIYEAAAGHGSFQMSAAIKSTATDARFQIPVQLISYAMVVAFVFLTARVKYHRGFGEAIQWRSMGSRTWMFVPAGLAMAFTSLLMPLIFPSDRHFPIEKMFRDPASGYLMMFFGIAVAPFVEELLFRGMIYPVIERRWGLEIAVLGSALLFAAIHGPQLGGGLPQIGAIFMVGVALGYARGRTGSLIPGFIIHTSYNATLLLMVCAATSGFRKLPPA